MVRYYMPAEMALKLKLNLRTTTAMIVTQFNTVALRLSESRGAEVMRPRVADASSSCRVSFGPESPTLDTLLQTATVSAKACFYAWTAGVPLSRYRTLPSNAVFQLLCYFSNPTSRAGSPGARFTKLKRPAGIEPDRRSCGRAESAHRLGEQWRRYRQVLDRLRRDV